MTKPIYAAGQPSVPCAQKQRRPAPCGLTLHLLWRRCRREAVWESSANRTLAPDTPLAFIAQWDEDEVKTKEVPGDLVQLPEEVSSSAFGPGPSWPWSLIHPLHLASLAPQQNPLTISVAALAQWP
jgi:hypothetical protein